MHHIEPLPGDEVTAGDLSRPAEVVDRAENATVIDLSSGGPDATSLDLRADASVIAVEPTHADVGRAAELMYRATHDQLTGLANRAMLHAELAKSLASSARTSRPVSLLFIDLDGFKQVNDVFGHATGDAVLEEVGKRILGVSRPVDLVARYGGDEFVMLCDDLAQVDAARSIATRIVSEIGRPFLVSGRHLSIGCSIGIALGGGETTPEDLLSAADAAMYRAKRDVRHIATSEGDDVHAEIGSSRPADMPEAPVVEYWPIVDLDAGHVVALKAACEGVDPEMGVDAVPRRRANRCTGDLVAKALAETANVEDGTDGLGVSVLIDLPATDLLDNRSRDSLVETIATAGSDGGRVILSIDGSLLGLVKPRTMVGFEDLGCRFALSSLGMAGLPLLRIGDIDATYLVIDTRLVKLLAEDPRGPGLIRAMAEIAGAHGMRTIAAGVERGAELGHLRSLGIDAAFGSAVSGPHEAQPLGRREP